jgi:outer membrane protein TolC
MNEASTVISMCSTQRSRVSAQPELINTRLQRLGNTVTLYKVPGGGWSE